MSEALYLETSAFLTWIFGEQGATDMERALGAPQPIVASSLTLLETERVLIRRRPHTLARALPGSMLCCSSGAVHARSSGLVGTSARVASMRARPFGPPTTQDGWT